MDKVKQILEDFNKVYEEEKENLKVNNTRNHSSDKVDKSRWYEYRIEGLNQIIETLEYVLGENTELERTLKSYREGVKEDKEELKEVMRAED